MATDSSTDIPFYSRKINFSFSLNGAVERVAYTNPHWKKLIKKIPEKNKSLRVEVPNRRNEFHKYFE